MSGPNSFDRAVKILSALVSEHGCDLPPSVYEAARRRHAAQVGGDPQGPWEGNAR